MPSTDATLLYIVCPVLCCVDLAHPLGVKLEEVQLRCSVWVAFQILGPFSSGQSQLFGASDICAFILDYD
jgi:hypothetical protein